MYLVLKRGRLREILSLAYKKAGGIYPLASITKIPKSTLSAYHTENRIINKDNFEKLIIYLNLPINKEDILEELPSNWRQIKGGKSCVETKKKNGTYDEQLKKFRKKNPQNLRLWHKKMKKQDIEKYYLMQYSRFKKIGEYKFVTNNGEKVRNKLEKEVADILKDMNLNYKYEPLVKAGGKHFFPDFLINNKIIIECTGWRGYDKAIKLKKKIRYLKKRYKVYVVIPKTLKRYYEILNRHLILGTDNLSNIIQKSE